MPRYIDADKADVERISCFYGAECTLEDVQEWLDEQPTANVVPRAEYEALRKTMLPTYVQAITEEGAMKIGYERGRAKVAREIFEEIENNYADFLFDGHRNIVVLAEKDFAELKDKYTKGGGSDV